MVQIPGRMRLAHHLTNDIFGFTSSTRCYPHQESGDMRSPSSFALIVSTIVLTGLACRGGEPTFDPEIPEIPPLPLGLDPDLLDIPEDNPITAAKVALGWQLFYDTRLSQDETISCASCHVGEPGSPTRG